MFCNPAVFLIPNKYSFELSTVLLPLPQQAKPVSITRQPYFTTPATQQTLHLLHLSRPYTSYPKTVPPRNNAS